jgi:hypothetical protein
MKKLGEHSADGNDILILGTFLEGKRLIQFFVIL